MCPSNVFFAVGRWLGEKLIGVVVAAGARDVAAHVGADSIVVAGEVLCVF